MGWKLLNTKILITGATGFIGRTFSMKSLKEGLQVRGTLLPNEPISSLIPGVEPVIIESVGPTTPWKHALEDIGIVFHLAARVHVIHETSPDPLKEFRLTNTAGTICLANQAAAAGVKRFVFMSTIGVNGNTVENRAFNENDEPAPHNAYSFSKFEAEIGLREISEKTGMEVVIVRAPLVYGPGNPGNFLSLLRIIARGFPLPLASVCNLRSFLYVENLADALICCLTHPNAAGKMFLVSDGEDVSTPDLIKRVAAALGRPARLFHFPPGLMLTTGLILGKSSAVGQLIGSLLVDSSKIRRELTWVPPFTMEEGLLKTADWFMGNIKMMR